MTTIGWVLMGVGLVTYIGAFARGAGPTMGDDTLQATMFTLATILMVVGFALVAII